MDVLIKLGFHHKGHSLAKDVIEATGAKNFL